MKRNVVVCEGPTDLILLQYYLRKALSWKDVQDGMRQRGIVRNRNQRSRLLEKGDSELTVMAAGGSSRIPEALANVLKRMVSTPPDGSSAYDNVVIVTDRDDEETERRMLDVLAQTLMENSVSAESGLACGTWSECRIIAKTGTELSFRVHVLIIPSDKHGAMETFLLDAIAKQDPYDEAIVRRCRGFVRKADPEGRYLTKRGYVTKAELDAFFSIRSSAIQFAERQKVLLSVDWEKYVEVNKGFSVFAEL